MRKIFLILLCLFICMGFSNVNINKLAFAEEKPSCDELTEMATALDDLSQQLKDVKTIKENDPLDKALGQVVKELKNVAKIERDAGLTKSVNLLADAYQNMEREKFEVALDAVITNFTRLYNRDCSR